MNPPVPDMKAVERLTFDELVQQLQVRCDRLLVVASVPTKGTTGDDGSALIMRWNGLATDAVGLAAYAQSRVLTRITRSGGSA